MQKGLSTVLPALMTLVLFSSCTQSETTIPTVCVRRILTGELVPVKGPHRAFQHSTEPEVVALRDKAFILEFHIGDDRKQPIRFVLEFLTADEVRIVCPLTNIGADKENTVEGKRINDAVRNFKPVVSSRNKWTDFFVTGSPVFPTTWQLWWGTSVRTGGGKENRRGGPEAHPRGREVSAFGEGVRKCACENVAAKK